MSKMIYTTSEILNIPRPSSSPQCSGDSYLSGGSFAAGYYILVVVSSSGVRGATDNIYTFAYVRKKGRHFRLVESEREDIESVF